LDAAEPTPGRTLAVLLGASWLPRAPDLAQGAAFSGSAQHFLEYVLSPTGLALPRENVNYLFDDNRAPADQLRDTSDFLDRRCREIAKKGTSASDLIVYYVGNGLFCGSGQALHLATRMTDPARDGLTSMPAAQLLQAISAGSAGSLRKFLVLDCVYSSAAHHEPAWGPAELASRKILEILPPRGAAVLSSALLHDPVHPAPDLPCTLFTASLLEALALGQAGLSSRLSLSEAGPLVKEQLRRSLPQEWARPEVRSPDRREGHVAHIGLFPNPAYKERQLDERPVAMVVDDSSVVRNVTHRLLERHGIRVIAAGDGMDAVELLQSNVPDVILLDIEMPRMDGFAVAAHVRKDPRTRDVPIVMITASEGTRNRARAFDLGVDDFLSKPYREVQLISVIRPLIVQSRGAQTVPGRQHAEAAPPTAVKAELLQRSGVPEPRVTREPQVINARPAQKDTPAASAGATIAVVVEPVVPSAGKQAAVVSADGGLRAVTLPVRAVDPAPRKQPAVEHAVADQRGWAVGDCGQVIEMADGGRTWIARRSATRRELSSVHFAADGLHGWAVGLSGTVIATRDGGKNWLRQRSQTRENLNSVFFSDDGRHGWAVGAVGEVIATRDGGYHWERQEGDTTYALNCVHFAADGRRGWAVGADGTVIATRNGGRTWLPQSTTTKKKLFSVYFLPDTRRGWAVGHRGVVVATDDSGETWFEQNSRTEMHLYSVFFVDGRRGWSVGRNGVVIATDNGGRTWLEQHSRTEATLNSVYFAADGEHGWAVGFNGTVISSSDGGKTWQEQRGPADMTLNCVCFLPGG
jgi:photosystem II stability/assembly factor-like uncharacterized protein/CheY-like chemotaxis protein